MDCANNLITSKLFIIIVVSLLFGSCEQQMDIRNDNSVDEYSSDFILNISAKILAYNIGKNKQFAEKFLQELLDERGIPNRDLFLSDVLHSISYDDVRTLSRSLNIDSLAFSGIKSQIRKNYPALVVKVPEWCVLLWNEENNPSFTYELVKAMTLGFIPKYQDSDTKSEYTVFTFDNNLSEKIIPKDNMELDFIPVILRFSEYHAIVNPVTYRDRKGNLITEEDISTEFKNALVENLIDEFSVQKINENLENEVILNWFDFIKAYRSACWNHIKPSFYSTRRNFSINGTEICDNNIDDDGDGFIDEDDSDCCSYYANCIRDCVRDYNYIRGLRMVSINSATVLNQNIMMDDNTHMRIVLNEFNGTGGGSPNKKTLAVRFMYLCDQTLSVNDYLYRASAHDSPGKYNSLFTGITVETPDGDRYINITYPNPVIGSSYNVLWKDEWNGDLLGKTIRTDIWYEDAEIENSGGSQMQQIQNSVSTEFGVKFGGGGENGFNPYPGFDIGYSNSNTTTSNTTITYQISTEARQLGNVDLQYCDDNSSITGTKNCSPRSGHYLLNGKELNTGTIRLYTSIEFSPLPN